MVLTQFRLSSWQPHRHPGGAGGEAERMYGSDSGVLSEPRESLLLLAESVLAKVRASKDR